MFPRTLAVAAAIALAPAASMAATMQANWFGTVEGYDATDHLGLGTNYQSSFSITITYDTDLGVTTTPPGGVSITGGGTWQDPSPITRVSLTFGTTTIEMSGDNYGQLHANAADPLAMEASYSDTGPSGRNDLQFSLFDDSMPTLGNLEAQLSIYHASRYFGGTLYMGGADADGRTTHYVTGSFYLSGVELRRFEEPAPVPLPAAAVLLLGGIAGLGLVKASARSRQA